MSMMMMMMPPPRCQLPIMVFDDAERVARQVKHGKRRGVALPGCPTVLECLGQGAAYPLMEHNGQQAACIQAGKQEWGGREPLQGTGVAWPAGGRVAIGWEGQVHPRTNI